MSPASCPQCDHYEFLTSPTPVEGLSSKLYREVVCENCGWIGEMDDLGEVDGD